MADYQTQSINWRTPPSPGFFDYAAQFLQTYQDKKDEMQKQQRSEMMALLPALAAQGQIVPGEAIPGMTEPVQQVPWAGTTLGIKGKPADQGDLLQQRRTEQLEIDMGLREPTDTYLKDKSVDAAYKMYWSSPASQMLMEKNAKKAGQDVDAYIGSLADQMFNQYKKRSKSESETKAFIPLKTYKKQPVAGVDYDPATQKVQQNKATGEWRIVSK